jgi:hypothetical protein
MNKIVAYLLLMPCLFLGACASGAVSQNMISHSSHQTSAVKNSALYQNIAIGTVGGGENTNPLWTSQVSNEAFAGALKDTLAENNYLAVNGNGRYLLHANLLELNQPLFGLTLNVTSSVAYTLEDKKAKKLKYSQKISETGSASFSDAALAIERLRISNERAIQKNLEALVKDLHQVK